MKKALLTLTFLTAGAMSLLSQSLVQFDNGSWNFTDGIDRNVYLDRVGGQLLDNPAFSAALFENVGGTWTQLGATVGGNPLAMTFDWGGSTVPGVWSWDGTFLATHVANKTETTLQVRVLNAAGNVMGQSDPFIFKNPGNEPAGTADPLMINFKAFALVPEPSTIALGVLGIGALLLFRRRK